MTSEFLQDLCSWRWRGWLLCRARFTPLRPAAALYRLAGDHGILLPAQIVQSVPKRQAEYLAGRLLLRQLQQQLALDLVQILPGADRSPQWPAGQQGSVSHSGDLVWAGLGTDPQLRLGVDLQHWLSAAQYHELAPAILTPQEHHWCQHFQAASDPSMTLPQLLTLIFAAKEALYKALYPDCRQIMEFSAAKVRALTSQQILLQLTVDWSAAWCAGTEIWLDYQLETDWVQVLTDVSTCTASGEKVG